MPFSADPVKITSPARRTSFGIPAIFATLTTAAVVCAVLAQIPHDKLMFVFRKAPVLLAGTVLMAFLPMAVANLACVALARLLPARLRNRSTVPLRLFAPHRLLMQAGAHEPPGFCLAALIALTTVCVLSACWGFMRELGLACSVGLSQGLALSKPLFAGIPELMTNTGYLYRSFWWELFSITRWWIFFAAFVVQWLFVAWPLRRRWPLQSAGLCLRRLLAFAPWLAVLETAFLVGVWPVTPNVVPEPATGFVEGIFSWEKWHWDCWLGLTWISRGLIPTLLVTSLFFRHVLQWRWRLAVAVAACLIPVALTLSIAWSVLYYHPEPLTKPSTTFSGYFR